MRSLMWERIDNHWQEILGILVSTFGGIVRGISCPRVTFRWWIFFQRVTSATFVGIISTFILSASDIGEGMKTAIAGAAGYSANDVLQVFKPWVKKKLGFCEEDML